MIAWLALACTAETTPSTTSGTTADTSSTGGTVPTSPPVEGGYFPAAAPWTTDVTDAAVDPESDERIAGLQDIGWGSGDFQMDWSFEILAADASTPRREFVPNGAFYAPDCDQAPVPIPEEGNLEGEDGYACTTGGDCHLLVAERDEQVLYEMWVADIRGPNDGQFRGGCLVRWDLTRVYPPEGRGEQCTSGDAAGYPIAPLLFTAEEVAAGHIDHAIRFAIPNDAIESGGYYHPASHGTNTDGDGTIPYGARLRLKADFDESRIADPDALVVVSALKKYGMFLADGGNIPLMGESDRRSAVKWDDLFEDGSHALFGIRPDDFELLALDRPRVPLTFDCVRNGY